MRPEIFEYIGGNFMLKQEEPFDKLIANGELMAYKYDGFRQCMDTVRDKRNLEVMCQSRTASWKLWSN